MSRTHAHTRTRTHTRRASASGEEENNNVVAASWSGDATEGGAAQVVACTFNFTSDGAFKCTFTPTIVATYSLVATLNGVQIPGVFEFTLLPTKVDVASSTAVAANVTQTAGVMTLVTIQSRDRFSNKLTTYSGRSAFRFEITGPNAGCDATGQWDGNVVASRAGEDIKLTFNGLTGTDEVDSGLVTTYALDGFTNLAALGQSVAGSTTCGSLVPPRTNSRGTGRFLLILRSGFTTENSEVRN